MLDANLLLEVRIVGNITELFHLRCTDLLVLAVHDKNEYLNILALQEDPRQHSEKKNAWNAKICFLRSYHHASNTKQLQTLSIHYIS